MTARNAALKTLVRIGSEQAFSNIQVNRIIEDQKVDQKDKNLYVNLVYGTLQHKLTLDYVLEKYITRGFENLNEKVLWALRLAAYQILYLNKTPDYAVVNEAVEQIKRIEFSKAKMANAVLRNIIRNKEELEEELDTLKDRSIKYSVPNWIIKKYQDTYADKADQILEQINENAPLTLRVKPGYLDKVFESLEKLGAEPELSKNDLIKDETIIVNNVSAITKGIKNSKAFQNGLVTIQDQGAIEIGRVLDPQAGDVVLDICSAPGGKTSHLANLMDNKGKIIACDIYPNRLKLVEETAQRLGTDKIITTSLQDGTIFNPSFENKFDKILVDAPCSGLGIIKRKPDIRYRVNKKDSEELAKIQKKILNNAFKYLKPGGKLVYSTCTVGREENEDIVNIVKELNPKNFIVEEEVHTDPSQNKGDSFYYATITKEK